MRRYPDTYTSDEELHTPSSVVAEGLMPRRQRYWRGDRGDRIGSAGHRAAALTGSELQTVISRSHPKQSKLRQLTRDSVGGRRQH
ncbi:unnamed protein product, partial [Iphiclides podalirius]